MSRIVRISPPKAINKEYEVREVNHALSNRAGHNCCWTGGSVEVRPRDE